MKKRILILAAAACAAACCLGGCGTSGKYDALNEMLTANYSQISLTVTDTFDENIYLTSEYTITYSDGEITVDYIVESFSEISIDDPPADVKTIRTGEAVIRGGEVVSVSGDDIHLTADIARMGLNFQEEYFENAELTGIYLKADVKDPHAFLGSELSCTDMQVEATFLEVFYDINIAYTSKSGSKVEYRYVFTL